MYRNVLDFTRVIWIDFSKESLLDSLLVYLERNISGSEKIIL